MFAQQDARSRQLNNPTLDSADRATEELAQANKVLQDLKPPPREREYISPSAFARDSRMGINEVAERVEETLRSSAQGANLSPSALSEQITLAKNFVTAEGSRSERKLEEKSINGATASDLKLAAAEANGTRIGEVVPNAIAVENAEKMSNASPTAQAIAQGRAIDIKIAEELALPLIQAIKESHDYLIGGQGQVAQTKSILSTPQSIDRTHQRLLAISQRFEEQLASAA